MSLDLNVSCAQSLIERIAFTAPTVYVRQETASVVRIVVAARYINRTKHSWYPSLIESDVSMRRASLECECESSELGEALRPRLDDIHILIRALDSCASRASRV